MFGDKLAFLNKSSQTKDHSLQLNSYRNSGKNLESTHPCQLTLRPMDKQNKSIKSWNNTYASFVTSNKITGQNSFLSWSLPTTHCKGTQAVGSKILHSDTFPMT